LTVLSDKVHDAAGSALGGGNYVFGAVAADKFFRRFGDYDGDRDVDGIDLARFKQALNNPAQFKWYLSYDGDGDVDSSDYDQFKQRYGRP
jgi:hypothetical protein